MKVQMLGLCRFSYLGGRGFQVEHDDLAGRRAFLYDPERLARRWFWFRHVTLPALMAQSDSDFTLVLMTGPDLPEPWLSQLRDLCDEVPQFRLSLVPPMERHVEACLAAIAPHLDPQADVVGHFRQDDDDAVAIDYIRDARRDFAALEPLWSRRRRLSCDYARGLVLKATADGVSVEPRMIHNAVAGLTVYLAPDAQRSIMHFPHWQIGLSMPGVTLPGKVMFVRFLNHDNDSGAIGAGYPWEAGETDWNTMLADRFRIDLAHLDRAARDFGLPGADRPRWGQ
ncbi:putative rhamnosyl transferase [Paracoccus spongiarum]|uniref:Rhamnosyl transferase n=1 Tax=Paracoccus spongiarum TaxID=3064387 RepID=A0ABT9JHD6_9RHOB|nr:putative rhamnosyl transferase [Paracoccus sp. 2205BS29-5]MDP5309237.1 putative rhamnosyl transferase [Paracoccus sp. 2205BS29-5]